VQCDHYLIFTRVQFDHYLFFQSKCNKFDHLFVGNKCNIWQSRCAFIIYLILKDPNKNLFHCNRFYGTIEHNIILFSFSNVTTYNNNATTTMFFYYNCACCSNVYISEIIITEKNLYTNSFKGMIQVYDMVLLYDSLIYFIFLISIFASVPRCRSTTGESSSRDTYNNKGLEKLPVSTHPISSNISFHYSVSLYNIIIISAAYIGIRRNLSRGKRKTLIYILSGLDCR